MNDPHNLIQRLYGALRRQPDDNGIYRQLLTEARAYLATQLIKTQTASKVMTEKPTHVWIFDANRRIYGEARRKLIWREHWQRFDIIGETSKSWIANVDNEKRKIPKRQVPIPSQGIAWSEEELDQLEWVHEHRYKISHYVDHLDPETLIKVARLIGYKPAPPTTNN